MLDFESSWDGSEDALPLTAGERLALAALRSPADRARWVLGRLTTKELARRLCATRWGIQPAAAEVELLDAGPAGPELRLLGADAARAAGPMAASVAEAAGFAIASVRPKVAGERFGVDIVHVEPRYPFYAEHRYTERERTWLASLPAVEADGALAGLWALKQATAKALGAPERAWGRVEVDVFSSNGESQVRVRPDGEGGASPHTVRAQAWAFAGFAIAFAVCWFDPAPAPSARLRIEENPVLPRSRRS